jgi:hypothetical protein
MKAREREQRRQRVTESTMRSRKAGVPIVTALTLIVGGFGPLMLAPSASARGHHRAPPYEAKHHTRADAVSGWVASYNGSSNWKVRDQRSIYEPDGPAGQANYSESSDIDLNLQPGRNQEASGFTVSYPTPCHEFRGQPCPPQGDIALGNGREKGSYKINDTFQIPGQGTTSIICSGPGDQKLEPDFSVLANYVRGADAYRILVDRDDESQIDGFTDSSCPSPGAVGNPLGDWFPTEEPGPAVTGDYWASAPVDVPVTVFAHSKLIQIEVSLRSRNAPDSKNCGLPPNPQSGNYNETCTIDAGWAGTLTLHRVG